MPQIDLYPAITGVFIKIGVDIKLILPQGGLVDSGQDTSNAKLMVFQTSKHIYNMFINGGSKNELILTGCSTERWTMRQCNEDALVWYLCYPNLLQYRVRFTDKIAVQKFSDLVSLWERSKARIGDVRVDETASRALKDHISKLVARQWDDEEQAFEEIDMLTSTFALFYET